jgi:N-acetylglutamate synthase-like GNAT family acetyltransferase
VQVRRVKSHEADVLTNIAMRAKQSNGYDASFKDACKDELTVTASHMKEAEYWVAELDTVRGFFCLVEGVEPKVGEVYALFIDPDWQRCVIGKSLWCKIIQRAELKGIEKIRLETDPAATSFY